MDSPGGTRKAPKRGTEWRKVEAASLALSDVAAEDERAYELARAGLRVAVLAWTGAKPPASD
jgi:hypothetical protein